MGQIPADHPHRVQANKKGESPSVSLESHKRRTGEGHSLEQPIHKTNQQWPVAVRAPMAHSKNPGGVLIEDHKTSYHLNPSVGNTLGGGFHCTTFDCMAQIFNEGLRPGGGGDRINTFFFPFAPWDKLCISILRYKKIEGATLVYIYLTYESLSKFAARISADGHILVQQTIPFNSFDAVWYQDRNDLDHYYRLLITKGYEQLVLSVRGAKKIATVDRFDTN